MNINQRWVILQHIDAPDDVNKLHFDLLLEDNNACRTWRLEKIPILDGHSVKAVSAPLHKLEWLEKVESAVSGGRGWATRIEGGVFYGHLPSDNDAPIWLEISSQTIFGHLELKNGLCTIRSRKFTFDKYS